MAISPFRPLKIQKIPPGMQPQDLLKQEGWFLLPDVFRTLFPNQNERYKLVFKQVSRLKQLGEDPWIVLGYLKIGNRVFVQMERFGRWLKSNPLFELEKVPLDMSFEDFLNKESGLFRLSEICHHFEDFLPFSYLIFKRQVDKTPGMCSPAGIFKFDKTYILDLAKFRWWFMQQLETVEIENC